MKLATIRSKNPRNREGELIIVSRNNKQAVQVDRELCLSLREAVENWSRTKPQLQAISDQLNAGSLPQKYDLNIEDCLAPLPRAPGFYDGSSFLSHVLRARKARGAEMPESARIVPLMYQGVSDNLLPHNAPLEVIKLEYGADFEGEFGVVTSDVPKGTKASGLDPHIILFTLFNDITYREIVKQELPLQFGFLQSKPNSSFAPFLVTPDELGSHWMDGRIQLDLRVTWNGKLFGSPNGKEMHFSFQELVAHACKTRPLSAGSIVGGGTVSNEDKGRGFACITEKRCQEILDQSPVMTPWLQPGDEVVMDTSLNDVSVFGAIHQRVVL